MRRANYEVQTDYISITDSDGRRHHFKDGDDLPAWVSSEQIKTLLDNNAIQEFGVLGNGR